MARTTELASIIGAGAAGATVAVLAVGGSLLLVLPTAIVVGLVTVLVGASRRHRTQGIRSPRMSSTRHT